LEVGAGKGTTTKFLCDGSPDIWTCLEPDEDLANEIKRKIENEELPFCCEVINGVVSDLYIKEKYDTILYIDVLEHIKHDKQEISNLKKFLKLNGNLIILAPAHNWLYSPFDQTIGHYRRYNKKSLKAIISSKLKLKRIAYLDSLGLLVSFGNKFFLRQANPHKEQIAFWDNIIIPLSVVFDKIFHYTLGKSVLGIWKRDV
jgi:hypothetical protein